MKQNNKYFTFGRQVIFVILTNIIMLMIAIIQTPIITKALGAAQYGTWSLISTAISLIIPFSMLSFSMSIIRFLANEEDSSKVRDDFFSACAMVIMAGAIFSLLFLLFSQIIAITFLKDTNTIFAIRMSSVLVLLNSLFPVLLAFFRRGNRIGLFNILNLGLSVFQTILLILFVTSGYQLTGVILASILSSLALNIIAFGIILKQIGFVLPRFTNMKDYLKWGIPLTPNNAIFWIIQSSDRYIIAFYLGVSSAGIYGAAYGIGVYSSFALYPIGIVLFPLISKAYDQGNLDECKEYLKYSFKYLMMVVIPAAFGLSVLASPLLNILTTPEFISGSYIVALVAFGYLLFCFYQIGSYVIQLVGKTYLFLQLLSIAAILNIILNILLVPHLGILGSGLASLVSFGVLGALTLMVTRRYLKFDLSLPFLFKSAVASLVMVLFIWILKPESLIRVLISIFIGIPVYFSVLLSIRGFSKYEIESIVSFIRNIKNRLKRSDA